MGTIMDKKTGSLVVLLSFLEIQTFFAEKEKEKPF